MSNENSERFKIFDMDVVRVAKDLAAVFVGKSLRKQPHCSVFVTCILC